MTAEGCQQALDLQHSAHLGVAMCFKLSEETRDETEQGLLTSLHRIEAVMDRAQAEMELSPRYPGKDHSVWLLKADGHADRSLAGSELRRLRSVERFGQGQGRTLDAAVARV